MTHEDQEIVPAQHGARPGLSRRGMLRGAGGIGIAALAAGVLVDTAGSPASAATAGTTSASRGTAPAGSPLVVHVHDARTGEVDLYTGEQHVRVHNPALVRALAQAAAPSR